MKEKTESYKTFKDFIWRDFCERVWERNRNQLNQKKNFSTLFAITFNSQGVETIFIWYTRFIYCD